MSKTALLAGYTGLVGQALLRQLLERGDYSQLKVVGRRAPRVEQPTLQYLHSDMKSLKNLGDALQADDAFCCLGTTIKAAGSRAAFERVDFHMVVEFARAAYEAGARRLFLVSSQSANPRAPFYYSRVKGRTEQAVNQIGFDCVHILRPSLLLGAREENRPGERLAQSLAPAMNLLMRGPFKAYRAVTADEVAGALIKLATTDQTDEGNFVHTLPLAQTCTASS